MPASHIQWPPAEFVGRQKVAEFQTRRGVERIFRLESTLLHIGRGSGGAVWTAVSKQAGPERSDNDQAAWKHFQINVKVQIEH